MLMTKVKRTTTPRSWAISVLQWTIDFGV